MIEKMQITIIKRYTLVVSIILLAVTLGGCGNTASVASEYVFKMIRDKVLGGIFERGVLDPALNVAFGYRTANIPQTTKREIADETVIRLANLIIPQAQASGSLYECKTTESQQDCLFRLESEVQYGFNIYAENFNLAFFRCRDSISGNAKTAKLSYYKTVALITNCFSDAGFEKEARIILNNIQGNST